MEDRTFLGLDVSTQQKSMRMIQIADRPQNVQDLRNLIRLEIRKTPGTIHNVQEECGRLFNYCQDVAVDDIGLPNQWITPLKTTINVIFLDNEEAQIARIQSPPDMEWTYEERDLFMVSDNYALAHCVARDLRLSRGIAACFAEKFGRLDGLEQLVLEVGSAIEVPGIQRAEPVFYLMTKELSEHKPTYESLKASVVNDDLHIIHEARVIFDSDLPEFRTQGGAAFTRDDPGYITAPTIMWVKALDMVMDRLTVTGVDFSKIAAISGSAQQHGSVYWQKGAEEILRNLNPSEFLHMQLASSFSVPNSPIWMDSSTTKQCKMLEETVGGPQKLAEITGSRAYERFTGSQIAKISQTKPDAYKNTERISLVSSFLVSLFLGKVAPIDISDGSGMNLFNIRTKKWNQQLLDACGIDLSAKLGEAVPSNTDLGPISNYFVERYNFSPNCRVIAATGDNPASLVGMRLQEGWQMVSLGTSDTVVLWLQEPKVVLNGHVLCNPVDENAYMALLCFKNGSLTRERIRDTCAEGSWDIFNQLLESTPRGNFGNMGLYYDQQEILPFLQGDYRYNKEGRVSKFTSLEVEVRAAIEGQFIRQRAYAEDFGFKVGQGSKILATGGASKNRAILQVLADVFNSPVYVQEAADSAMFGAAYQAKHGLLKGTDNFFNLTATAPKPELFCEPYGDAADIYPPMVERFRNILKGLTNE